MKRVYGSMSTPRIECINRRLGKWRIRCDYRYENDEERDMTKVSFIEIELSHKPTMDEVKGFILGVENDKIDLAILSGFEWMGMKVWLSMENQFNYKATYDLAVQTNGSSLPVTFKFGTTESPVYHEFSTLEELADFYTNAMAYINATLKDGWAKKDSFDWAPYMELLNGDN